MSQLLSDEEIAELIRPAGFSMVSAFADRAEIAKLEAEK